MEQRNFEDISVQDLLADDDFVKWVKAPDEKLDTYWGDLRKKQVKADQTIAEARRLVQLLEIKQDLPPKGSKRRVFDSIKKEIASAEPSRIRKLNSSQIFGIAASIIAVVAVGVWFYQFKNDGTTGGLGKNTQLADIMNEGALYLSDGRTIGFAGLGSGTIAAEGTFQVSKAGDNQLVYQLGEAQGLGDLRIDSITGPLSAVWQVALPDGSVVWLNSKTTIRFPELMGDSQREVSISGQAFFEVAHDDSKPFVVEVGSVSVSVLGTRFDVSHFAGNPHMDITLFDGAVQVQHQNGNEHRVSPGEQARYTDQATEPTVQEVDLQYVGAWKNGVFEFDGDTIEDVMHRLRMWYGVEVVYDGPKPQQLLTGTVPQGITLEEVLDILQKTGTDAEFQLTGSKIMVSRK